MSRLGNGTGSVYKLSGKRKNPWVARKTVGFQMNGHPIYRYIGYYRTKAEALEALFAYNKSPYSLEKETIKNIYERFIVGYKAQHKPKTNRNVDVSWRHLEPLYDKPIATLSRRDLQLYFDDLNYSHEVKQKIKILLKQIYGYAIRYDIIPPERVAILDYIDISSTVEVKKIERDRFTNEEIEKIKEIDDYISHVLLFLIYTGLRAGEFCNLTEDSIDDDYVIHIGDSKTEAGLRQVPLSDKAKKLLPLPHTSDYDTLRNKFNAWQKKNGFERNLNLHCTRYTTVSLLVEKKVDDRVIKAIVGHRSGDVTSRVYTKITNEEKRNALNLI